MHQTKIKSPTELVMLFGILIPSFIFLFSNISAASSIGQMGGQKSEIESACYKPGLNKVSFSSEGAKIVGHLFVPLNYKKTNKYPAIVVVTPQGGVKEQTAGVYAKKMSEQGFITLAFDHRTYGESEGTPRQYENPYMKTEDIKNAISFIRSQKNVDQERVGLLGICSGAGYSSHTAVYDRRVKAFATISGVFDFRDAILNGKTNAKENFVKLMKKAGEARQKYFETGEVEYVELVPDVNENTNQLWREAYEYYRTPRGKGPIWENKKVAFGFDTRRSFNTTEQLELLNPTPFLAIAGENALTKSLSETAVKRVSEPKELYIVNGATHIDLYDIDKYVDQAVKKLNDFYKSSLN